MAGTTDTKNRKKQTRNRDFASKPAINAKDENTNRKKRITLFSLWCLMLAE